MPVCGPTGGGGAGTWQHQGLPVSSATFADRGRMGGPRQGVHVKVRAGPEGSEEAESTGRKAEATEEANDTGSNGGVQNQLK